MNNFNESLLEMIYFHPIKEAFHDILGTKKVNAIYKPSQQNEEWLGFDQAWTNNNKMSEKDFYHIISTKSNTTRFYAYIIQFKVVTKQRHYSNISRTFTVPYHYKDGHYYYRSSLKTKPSKKGKKSQHDLLMDIKNRLSFAEVYYACPMIPSQLDLFNTDLMKSEKAYRDILMDKLVLIDVSTAPDPLSPTWTNYDKHHIMWKESSGSDMEWCSEPKQGKKIKPEEWIENSEQKFMDKNELLENIEELKRMMRHKDEKDFRDIYSKFTILEID